METAKSIMHIIFYSLMIIWAIYMLRMCFRQDKLIKKQLELFSEEEVNEDEE